MAAAFALAPITSIVCVCCAGPIWRFDNFVDGLTKTEQWNMAFLIAALLLAVIAAVMLGSSWWKRIVYPMFAALGIIVAFPFFAFAIIGTTFWVSSLVSMG